MSCRFIRGQECLTLLALSTAFLFAQTTRLPNWWFSADPKAVMADPLFLTLAVSERSRILAQIDSRFAKMSSQKREGYLWWAETAYLPKAAPPKRVFTWTPTDPDCVTELTGDALRRLTKTIHAASLRVSASCERQAFLSCHLRIANESSTPVLIRPQTFLLDAIKPKRATLYFEYPSRVYYELFKVALNLTPTVTPTERTTIRSGSTVATLDAPDETSKQEAKDAYLTASRMTVEYARSIVPNSLAEASLQPGSVAEGNVFFGRSDKVSEVVLRVFVSDVAFDIPLTVPKR